MSGYITGVMGLASPQPSSGSDPFFSNVVLLAGFNGVNGATTSPDESQAAHGNALFIGGTVLDTSQFQFGPSSLVTNGSFAEASQWLTSADWNLGSGNFTIECWINTTTTASSGYIFARWDTIGTISYVLWRNGATLNWNTSTTGSDNNADIVSGSVLVTNTWTAVAIDFNGAKYRLYKDGTMISSFSTPRTLFNLTNPISVGGSSANLPSNTWTGWIDEVRLTKGIARYASDSGYVVSSVPFPRS